MNRQVLTVADKERLRSLGGNGDRIGPTACGTWTGSLENRQGAGAEVLGGAVGAATPRQFARPGCVVALRPHRIRPNR